MTAQPKFHCKASALTVTGPFDPQDRQEEEEAFLSAVDRLVGERNKGVVVDMVQAGSLSSTALALAIAACRKATEKNKRLTLRVARRNAMVIRVSGVDKLMDVQLV